MLEQLWTEKYRPKTLNDIMLPEKYKDIIINSIKNKKIPHYLFIGNAGTGKTSLALVIINELNAKSLILNASDERGIDTIRNKVGNFVKVSSDKIKIVFLDEADSLTPEAQTSLRNIMETYSNYCRFILTGNYDKFIDPIKDRCEIVYFEQTKQNCFKILKRVIENEKIKVDENILDKIIDIFFPSIRKMIMTLQEYSEEIDDNTYKYILNLPENFDKILNCDETYEEIWNLFKKKNINKIREIIYLQGITDYIPLYRYFFNKFIEYKREYYSVLVAEYMYRDSVVADKELNFISMLIAIYNGLFPFITKDLLLNNNKSDILNKNIKNNLNNKNVNKETNNEVVKNNTNNEINNIINLPIYNNNENEKNNNNEINKNENVNGNASKINNLIKNKLNKSKKSIDDVIGEIKV